MRQHQEVDPANKPETDFGGLSSSYEALAEVEIFLNNAFVQKKDFENKKLDFENKKLDSENCLNGGENIATSPISDVSPFLTKCICNLIHRLFFANIPRERLFSHFLSTKIHGVFLHKSSKCKQVNLGKVRCI